MINPHMFSNERELEDYLVTHPDLLGGIVVRRQPRTPCNGRPDVLVLDEAATLHQLELKLFSTFDKTLGQIFEYAFWIDKLTMEDLIKLAAKNGTPIDLPYEFKKRFGRELPAQLNGLPRLAIIAASFDRRTFYGIQGLLNRGVEIRTFRHVGDRRSVQVLPFTATDFERQERRTRSAQAAARGRVDLRWRPSKIAVHEDIRCFWEHFSPSFVWDFVPFSFLETLYEAWCQTEEFAGHPRSRHQWGQFGRQLSQLARELGEWTYQQRFCPGLLMDVYEPLVKVVPTWTQAAPDHAVAGYLRRVAVEQ